MTDLTELRRLAEALIDPEYGGRWSATHGPRELPRIWADDQGVTAVPIFVAKSVEDAPEAEFVAAANPAVVLELLDATEALTAEPTEAEIRDSMQAIHRELASAWMTVGNALEGDQVRYEALLRDISKAVIKAAAEARR